MTAQQRAEGRGHKLSELHIKLIEERSTIAPVMQPRGWDVSTGLIRYASSPATSVPVKNATWS